VRPSGISVIAPLTIEKEAERPLEQAAPIAPGLALEGPTALGDFAGRSIGTPMAVGVPEPAIAAPPPAPAAPIRAGQGVREPKKIVDVPPVYPEIARRARVQGVVILEAVINEHGGVERLKLLRSEPLLDAAAMDAVARWRYTPTLLNGVPVSVLMTITIHFTLQN
jgi:protein TonB